MKTNPVAKSETSSSKHPTPVAAFPRARCRSTFATAHPTNLLRQPPPSIIHHPASSEVSIRTTMAQVDAFLAKNLITNRCSRFTI